MGTLASELGPFAEELTDAPRVYCDANLPAGLIRFMRERLGWDALFVLEEPRLRRASDLEHFRLAAQLRRTLLTLDTVTGSAAELLYRSLGYVVVGVIPAYARGALTPALESTTIMYKQFNPTVGSQTGAG